MPGTDGAPPLGTNAPTILFVSRDDDITPYEKRTPTMPFKTQYGSHYHMTEGCHGATIPCDTTGLTPCSDCCGMQAGSSLSGGSAPSGASAGVGSPSGQGEGQFAYDGDSVATPDDGSRDGGSDRDIVLDGNRIADAGRTAFGSGSDAPSVAVDAEAIRRMAKIADATRELEPTPMPTPPITRRKVLHRLADNEVPEPVAGHVDDRTGSEVANAMEQDVSALADATAKLRKAKGHTADILDEVSRHMQEVSSQMRAGADGKASSFDRARAFRMLNLDLARLENDIDYMRGFGGEEGQVADVASEVAEHLSDTLKWIRLDAKRNG